LPKFNFFDTEAPIYSRSRYLPPSKLHDCDIDNSMVSEGCILNGVYARRSIIGLRSRIDTGVKIEQSIIMGSDYFEPLAEIQENLNTGKPHLGIGKDTVIRRAIVDKNVRIGKDVMLLNEAGVENADGPDRSFYIRDGIIIVPKGATVPDGTIV
jgi:glucose-1-phosphate adenylyltransferase